MIHPYDPQAAMNAKYEALARKDADTARRLGPSPWRDDWMPAKETLMDTPARTTAPPVPAALASELVSLASRLLQLRSWLDDDPHDEELRRIAVRLGQLANGALPRPPQAAGDANGAGDDAGAAHGSDEGAAGHTEAHDHGGTLTTTVVIRDTDTATYDRICEALTAIGGLDWHARIQTAEQVAARIARGDQ